MAMPFSILAQEEQPEDVTQLIDHVGWYEWILAFLVVLVALIGGRLIRRALSRGLAKTAVPPFAAIVLGKAVVYVAVVLGLYFALTILRLQVGPLIGALGLAGLALAFAFQDILENFIAGLLMLMRRPIKVGDEMESSGYKGDVNDMTLRAVAIDTYDGDRVYIPNSMVWKNPLVNFTETPLRRTTLVVGVAYRTDLDFAQQVLQEAIDNVDGVVIPPPATVEFVEFNNSSHRLLRALLARLGPPDAVGGQRPGGTSNEEGAGRGRASRFPSRSEPCGSPRASGNVPVRPTPSLTEHPTRRRQVSSGLIGLTGRS